MGIYLPGLVPVASITALSILGCQEESHGPSSRPETPSQIQEVPRGSALASLDLIYICGNKFLVTNALDHEVHVTYRVAGTEESGDLLLRVGTGDDEGHGETELRTIEGGTVEIYRDGERVARRHNTGLPCGPSASFSRIVSLTSSESGSWSAPFPWPVVAVHISLLPTGRILFWGKGGHPHVWDPHTGIFSQVAEPVELFCSGHSLLPDGNLLVSGGHITTDHGLPDLHLFNSASESWSRVGTMRLGRWYPTNTTLGNGDVLILAGRDESGVVVEQPEIWSSGSIRPLTGAARILPFYPRVFLAPSGQIFYAGSQQVSHYLDVSGTGLWTRVGDRLYGSRDYGTAVMYDVGKILYAGGGRTTNSAEIIDLNSPSPSWQWTGSMAFPRRHLNGTVLPTGDVLVTGGSSGTAFNDMTLAVHAAELWNPGTGTWTTLASNSVRRVYHATSLLLPDGRVLHTGSGDGAGGVDENNAELFSPPYLFKGSRPVINSAPTGVAYNTSFQVSTPDAAEIEKVSLIRLGSVTHAFDMNQRFVPLSFRRDEQSLSITAPSSRNKAPPGHYMLFILNASGVPSIAKIINLGSDAGSAPPVNTPPTADFSAQCTGLGCTFTDGSTDADGSMRSWSWSYGDGTSGTAQSPRHTYLTEGSYEVTLEVTDDDQGISRVTKTVTVAGAPPANTAPTARFTYSCQGYACHFTDGSTDDDGSVTGWRWEFGDGTEASTRSPDHTYTAEGTYDVVLTATDQDGATGTITQRVEVTPPQQNTPPTAEFTYNCVELRCSFSDVSADEEGSIVTWRWDFGDGSSSTEPNPTHTYAAEGSYKVTLTATDNGELTDDFSTEVVIVQVPSNSGPAGAFDQVCDGLTCAFSDHSTDTDGRVAGWSWDFGDGTNATTGNPIHTYSVAGSYNVMLVVTDDDGASGRTTKSISVTAPRANIAPSAAFTHNCIGLSCTFMDGSSDVDGTVTTRSWSFGEGGSATGTNPSYTYAAGGTYLVVLRVTDDEGATKDTSSSLTVAAPNKAPAAAFTYGCTGFTCRFINGSTDSDGTVTDWRWTFGDGTSSILREPSRTYAAAGTYTVTLRATDDDGAMSQTSIAIRVVANRPPTTAFTHSCTGLTCRFTDRSTDSDGTIATWRWTFGNGTTATIANPSRTYAAQGTYTVTLRTTDNSGASSQTSASVTVPRIVLSVAGRLDATKQYMTLTWSGALGSMVTIYRNGNLFKNEINDGHWINTRLRAGAPSQYTYKVCQVGTTLCSNLATVRF